MRIATVFLDCCDYNILHKIMSKIFAKILEMFFVREQLVFASLRCVTERGSSEYLPPRVVFQSGEAASICLPVVFQSGGATSICLPVVCFRAGEQRVFASLWVCFRAGEQRVFASPWCVSEQGSSEYLAPRGVFQSGGAARIWLPALGFRAGEQRVFGSLRCVSERGSSEYLPPHCVFQSGGAASIWLPCSVFQSGGAASICLPTVCYRAGEQRVFASPWCVSERECEQPPSVRHGELDVCAASHAYGATCSYACHPGYELPLEGVSSILCTVKTVADGGERTMVWSHRPDDCVGQY